MRDLQDVEREGILPRVIANYDIPMCTHCQIGKTHKRAKANKQIIKENIKHPGDLIHMDQAVSSLIGRWLVESGRLRKTKCTTISIFVDSISKKISKEFHKGETAK